MKPKIRKETILNFLLEREEFYTLNEIALEFNVTSRTIASDLREIESDLLHKGYVLEKKRGVGIKVKKLTNVANQEVKNSLYVLSKNERISQIINRLLIKEEVVTYDGLSHEYNVSVSSIRSDIDLIQKLITRNNNLNIRSDNQGTRIIYNELDLHSAIENYVEFAYNEESLLQRNKVGLLNFLENIFNKDIVINCVDVIDQFIKSNEQEVVDYYYQNILIKFVILTSRSSINRHFKEVDLKRLNISSAKWNYENTLILNMHTKLNIDYTREDIIYLNYMMYLLHFEFVKSEDKYLEISSTIVEKLDGMLNTDLRYNSQLISNLAKHLGPMILRISSGVEISNPFNVQIKNEMNIVYNSVCMVLSEMEEVYYKMLNENEIGYLTLHIQSAIEQENKKTKVLIVCPNGISTSNLLWNRLIKVLPIFIELEQISASELYKINEEKYKLIISTSEIKTTSNKYILVSPFLDYKDKKLIFEKLEINMKNNFENVAIADNEIFEKIIQEQYISIEPSETEMIDILKKICLNLENDGIVGSKFFESVIHREKLGGTELPFGVAIPHGKPRHVKNSIIYIVTSEKGIKWNGSKVNMVILLCISNDDLGHLKDILFYIDEIIKDKKNISEIVKNKNKNHVIKMFRKGK